MNSHIMVKCTRCGRDEEQVYINHPNSNLDVKLCRECWTKWVQLKNTHVFIEENFYKNKE